MCYSNQLYLTNEFLKNMADFSAMHRSGVLDIQKLILTHHLLKPTFQKQNEKITFLLFRCKTESLNAHHVF